MFLPCFSLFFYMLIQACKIIIVIITLLKTQKYNNSFLCVFFVLLFRKLPEDNIFGDSLLYNIS